MRFARRPLFLSCLLVAQLLLGACDSSNVTPQSAGGEATFTCALQAGPNSENSPLTVRYSADLSGDALITELTYTNNNGTQRRDSVGTSWSKEVPMDSGRDVEITADVEMTGGSAKVTYVARDSTGEVSITDSDQCGTS